MLYYFHGIIAKAKNWTQETLSLKWTLEPNVSIAKRTRLDLHDAHLMDFLKEGAQGGLQALEIILVNGRSQLHDRQVFIVQV